MMMNVATKDKGEGENLLMFLSFFGSCVFPGDVFLDKRKEGKIKNSNKEHVPPNTLF